MQNSNLQAGALFSRRQRSKRWGWTLFIMLLAGYLAASTNQLWQPLQNSVTDRLIRLNAAQMQPDPTILILDIDDKSLHQLQLQFGRWPWPRSLYAYLIEGIQTYQPKLFAFDILLAEKDADRPADDAYFLETLAQQPNVFLSATFLPAGAAGQRWQASQLPLALFQTTNPAKDPWLALTLPLSYAMQPDRIGLINALPDADGIYRHYQYLQGEDEWQIASLPVRMAAFLGQAPLKLTAKPHLLSYTGQQTIPYPSISLVDALQIALDPQPQYAELFKNKIIIIGSSAAGLADLKHTALAPAQPGYVLIATMLDNLLHQQFLQLADPAIAWLFSLTSLLLMLWLFLYYRSFKMLWLSSSLLLLGLSLMLLLVAWLALKWQLILPVAEASVMLLVSYTGYNTLAAIREYQDRQHTAALFSRFLDPTVVKQLLAEPEQETLIAPQKTMITVLFTDIRNFTGISEQLPPAELLQLLNRYLETQVASLFLHQATLDKFIGDAIMAFWGAPLPQAEQANLALSAALQLVENLNEFKRQLPAELADFDIGIGIHTGEAVVGMLGSAQRIEYTAIGDTVNLASRIEGQSKTYGRILCSEETKNATTKYFPLHFSAEVQVKGRRCPVRLYRLGEDL